MAVVAAAIGFIVMPVLAHSPTDMTIRFDPETAKIYVTLTHPVDDPATHYLKTVRVKLNGLVISDPLYKSQPAKDTFTLTYDVNANAGDAIWVTAICNRFGTLEKSYEVPQPVRPTTQAPARPPAGLPPATLAKTQPPQAASPTAKAASGLLPLLGAAIVLVIRKT